MLFTCNIDLDPLNERHALTLIFPFKNPSLPNLTKKSTLGPIPNWTPLVDSSKPSPTFLQLSYLCYCDSGERLNLDAKPRCESVFANKRICWLFVSVCMDSPLLTLFICIHFVGLFPLIVDSQQNVNPPPPVFSPPPPSPPPPQPDPPPPPSSSPPPPSPPPPSPPPPSPPPPPPPPSPSPPPPPPSPRRRFGPPPPQEDGQPPNTKTTRDVSPPPPRRENTLNTGKRIGLMFIGIVVILQVCVAGFLFIRRRQLFKAENSY